MVPTLEALRNNVVSGLPVIPADIRNFIEPRGVVYVTGNVHLLSPFERNVRKYGHEHLGVDEAHFVHQDEIGALPSASLQR